MPDPSRVSLDAEQASVAHVPASVRQIVLAGPGSGKTEVVAALVDHLVADQGVSATDELLVISFSRAAVSAVRARTAVAGAPRITVRTLDAFAARLLEELDESDDWYVRGFDQRVARATGLLSLARSAEINMLRHLVVDEVQDVVGVRAAFLARIIEHLPAGAGFTLLGDPMQAVYDFQLSARYPMTSAELLSGVRATSDVVERTLMKQYRARSAESVRLLGLGHVLTACNTTEARIRALDAELASLLSIGAVEGIGALVPRWKGSTAVLCGTNGEALLAAAALRQNRLDVRLQRSAQEPAVSPLIAHVLADAPAGVATRVSIAARAHECGEKEGERFAKRLSDLARGRGPNVDVAALARRLASGAVPLELQQVVSADVVVSTVHRAKGLEFDNVVLVGGSSWLTGIECSDADVRTTFVSLTRARERVVLSEPMDTRRLWLDGRSGRWIRVGSHRWMTCAFELQGADTRWPAPVGQPPEQVQQHLEYAVAPGDAVELPLDPRASTLDIPVYSVMHEGRLIGRTTQDFGTTFVRRIGPGGKRTRKPWPSLSGAVVESVETLAGHPQPIAEYGGVGRWGLWLSVRLTGMVELKW